MRLLVGLGNPGEKYRETRHNVGFRIVDALARREGLSFAPASRFRAETCRWESPAGRVLLVKPQTFMNDSGEAVGRLARYYNVPTDAIFVVYDDLDLDPGRIRIRHGGGHGGHNGLRSLNRHLPDSDYTRIKIGIGRPPRKGDVTPWVLGRAPAAERALETRVIDCLLPHVAEILAGDAPRAANRIHLCLQDSAGD